MKKNTTVRGPGRPMADINIPNKKFTFSDLVDANTHVTPLTLRKFLKRDMFTDSGNAKNTSRVVLVKDESREPNSAKGLGRKTFVYAKRAGAKVTKVAKSPKAAKSTPSYEDTKAALLTPAVEVNTPAPVAEVIPTAPETAPAIA